ncbi:MAG: hypothetical protein HYY05_06230 [Chloroflexi bacterium]|nr:hypothetical protein [Chloroflexota bacterium]
MRPARALSLIAIVLLGAFLRLYQLDLTNVTDDEVVTLDRILDWFDGGPFPLVGVRSSTRVERPAGMSYLLAPILLVSRDPLAAAGALAALNVLSVILCYRLVSAYFDRQVALLAALLYAAGFWAAYGSRHAWDMAPMGPLALLVLDRILAATVRGQPGALGWATFWALLAVAVHPSAMGLIGAVLVTGLALRPPVQPAKLAPGLLLAGLAWMPFAWHLAATGLRDVGRAADVAAASLRIDLEMAAFALWQVFPHPRDPLFQSRQGSVIPGSVYLELVHALVVAGFLVSLLWCGARGLGALRHPRGSQAPYLVLALSYLVPIVMLVPHPFPLYTHYSFPLLPYSAIILAVGLAAVARALLRFQVSGFNGWWGWAWGTAVALAAVQVWILITLLDWTANRGATFPYDASGDSIASSTNRPSSLQGTGVPLRFARRALQVAAQARASPADPIHIAPVGNHNDIYGYLARHELRVPLMRHSNTLAFPAATGEAPVYLTVADGAPLSQLLRQAFPDAEQLRLLRSSFPDYYRVSRLPPDAGTLAQEAAVSIKGPWPLANGIGLEGYAQPEETRTGEDITLTLGWTEWHPGPDPSADERFFVHLVDRQGRMRGEADERDYPIARGRAGDRFVAWLRVPVPADAPRGLYSLRFGVVDAASGTPVAIDVGGATQDALLAEPLRVQPFSAPDPPAHAVEPPARFGGSLDLLGYDLPPSAQGGAPLDLRLLWRAAQPVAADYTLFVHLLDQQGRLLAQEDSFPAGGLYPTSAWRAGEVVEDLRHLSLPASAAGQQITVALGWYRLDTGQRLPLDDGASTQSALLLGPVAVGP